ncbi:MAG: hypothetical protein ACKPKO_60935, partial [Candidatus Fonsibacter sp.]
MKILVECLEEFGGYSRVIVRSDQQPAILKLKGAVKKRELQLEVVCEESPVGESQALGTISSQIQVLQGQVRTIRDALETRQGRRIDGNHALVPWMVQHAAGILNRYSVGKDGRTAY